MEKKPEVKDGSVVINPQNNYYNPDKNFNTGGSPSVVIIGGKPVEVKDGQVIKKGNEKTEAEQVYEKDNKESLE